MSKTKTTTPSAKRFPAWLIAILGLAVVLIAAFAVLSNPGGGAPAAGAPAALPAEIDVDEAYQLVQDGAFLLDVRTQEEYDAQHVPGVTLIPLDQLESRVNEVPTDKPVVVICRSGNRSDAGRDILLQAGYQQVTSVNGGIQAWQSAGYPVE